MKIPNRKNTRGYSLLELVLVLAIVAVLVGLLLPKGFDALRNARIQQVAEITGLEVIVGSRSAGAQGAAILAGIGTGVYRDEQDAFSNRSDV